MRNLATSFFVIGFLLLTAAGCEDKDAIPETEMEMPSISVTAQGHLITDDVILFPVIEESIVTIDYTVSTSTMIKQFVQSLDGVEQTITEADGLEEYTGQLVINVPYANKTIVVQLKVTDEDDQSVMETISVVVTAAGEFTVDGNIQVTGHVRQGKELVISGSGFGSGPGIVIYDDFEGGGHNDPIPLTSPLIGKWAAASSGYIARYHEYGYSGNTSFSMQDDLAAVANYGKKDAQLKARFADTQEVFISYQVSVPPGKHFPGAPTREEWGAASHWKLTWLMDGDNGFSGGDGKADLCIPTNGQAKALQIVGNTDNIGWVGSLDDLFDMDGFNRVAVWLRADPESPETAGYTWIHWLSAKTNPAFTREHILPVFNARATSPTSYQWNQLNVPGWFGNDLTNPGGVYDDVYLATGANAAARVEVGDAPDYEDCTELSIMPSLSWTDSEIKVVVKTKGTETISGKYLFIFDSNNELITDGIAIP